MEGGRKREEVPSSTPNQSLRPPHRRAWSPALQPQRADDIKKGSLPQNVFSTPRTRIQSWARITRRRAGKAEYGPDSAPYSAEEIRVAAEWVVRKDAERGRTGPVDERDVSGVADGMFKRVFGPDPTTWMLRACDMPPMQPRRLCLEERTRYSSPSTTRRPPGATPSRKEFETIASAWSRARNECRRLLSSPSNCEDWSSGVELDEQKEKTTAAKDAQGEATQQSADGDGLLVSAKGRARYERVRVHLAAFRQKPAQQRAAPARASGDAEKGAPSKNQRRPSASTPDCVRAMGGPQKASLLGPIVKGPGPAPHVCVQPVLEEASVTTLATEASTAPPPSVASEEAYESTLATETSTAPPPSVATLLGVEEETETASPRRPERTATTVLPIAAETFAATPSTIAMLGSEEDDADPAVALFTEEEKTATDAETALAPSPAGERTPPRPQPLAGVNHAATPFSMARLDACVEDEGDPLALAFPTATTAAAKPIAAVIHAATPSSMARLGAYLEDEDDPLVLAVKTTTTDAATKSQWSPHRVTPPAIVETIASSLAALAREGHREDDCDPPVARRRSLNTPTRPPRTQHTTAATNVLGDIASRFESTMNGLGFRKGVG